MNILFTVSTYLPHIDGIQFVTTYLAEGLVKKGHKVEVITYSRPEIDFKSSNNINGVHVIRWNAKTRNLFHKGDKREYQQFILDNQDNYDVIINVGTQTAFTDWLFPIMKKIKVPLILHTHSIWDFKIYPNDRESIKKFIIKLISNLRWGIYYLINCKNFKRYCSIIQLHEKDHSVKFFEKYYSIESNIIGNAVDENFFQEVGYKEKPEKYIVKVANFNKMKNQKETVDVFLKADIPNEWKLVLVGSKENTYCKEVKKYIQEVLAKNNSNKKIEIYTGIERNKIYDLIRNSSLFITTSLREAFPISIIEAMAASIPFLSYDVGIVKNLPGGIIAENERDMIEKLNKLVASDTLRDTLGKQGYEYAISNSRISKKVDDLEKLILEIIN